MTTDGLVSLSYDGALLCHLETALPHLEEVGLKATFYCEPALLLENLPEWAHVLASGHELANGALHGAVMEDGSLPGWTLQMVREDVIEAKALLEDLFPEQPDHSFGFPWGKALSDGTDVTSAAQDVYPVVRLGEHGVNKAPWEPRGLNCVQCDDLDSSELIAIAKQALEPGSWVVFSFEGVGAGDRAVDAAAHRDLCLFLANEPRLTVLPVCDVATSLASLRAQAYKLV